MSAAKRIAEEAESEARAILAWWTRRAVDREHGGFFGEIDASDAPVPRAEKGAILNSRILWFFSEAAAHLGDPESKSLANRAADYIAAHFLDPVHGGVYWSLDCEGRPRERKKQGYAQAFAIYALCAHHRATGDAASIQRATALFQLLERHYADRARGGYLEALTVDFRPIADMRLSSRDANAPKTANSHLHLLEAFTPLHEIAPSPATAAALRHCIELFLDRFINFETGQLRQNFDLDWNPLPGAASFGHGIEASWLIWAACGALRDDALSARARPLVLALARACRDQAQDGEGAIMNERDAAGALDARRVWWVQAEAMVGFLNAYEMSGDADYFAAFEHVWDFVKRRHRDPERGEWTWWAALDAPDSNRTYKAGFWKGPYHNGRAMFESMARLARLADAKT